MTNSNICAIRYLYPERVQNRRARAGKEKGMEMTNEQFRTFIKMIIQIITDSKDKAEAVKKIEALINKD